MRDRDWKFISVTDGDDRREQLYHLREDPREQENVDSGEVATRDRFREIVTEHERAVAETATDLDTVAMDEDVKARLRDLGYAE